MKKAGLALVGILILFLGYVSTRSSHFHYERSALIQAPVQKVFPVISTFESCRVWNPFDQKDPAMKRSLSGIDGQVGAKLAFDGNKDVGAGELEISKVIPDQLLELRLSMTRPMHVQNVIRYALAPEGSSTRFTWSMEGESGFLGKLISVLIDCEKMMAEDMEKGIANLKGIVEAR